jgi:hypothetical protein
MAQPSSHNLGNVLLDRPETSSVTDLFAQFLEMKPKCNVMDFLFEALTFASKACFRGMLLNPSQEQVDAISLAHRLVHHVDKVPSQNRGNIHIDLFLHEIYSSEDNLSSSSQFRIVHFLWKKRKKQIEITL